MSQLDCTGCQAFFPLLCPLHNSKTTYKIGKPMSRHTEEVEPNPIDWTKPPREDISMTVAEFGEYLKNDTWPKTKEETCGPGESLGIITKQRSPRVKHKDNSREYLKKLVDMRSAVLELKEWAVEKQKMSIKKMTFETSLAKKFSAQAMVDVYTDIIVHLEVTVENNNVI